MNKIDDLILIISSLGGEASLDEISKKYGKVHSMVMFNEHKTVILNTLKSNNDKVFYDKSVSKWKLKTACETSSKRYLKVSDNKTFSTIRKAMAYIFNKSVPSQGGYFNVDKDHDAWFPQPSNKEWKNELSEDGKLWYETPSDKKNLTVPSSNLRYVFIRKEGYKFTGVFKFKEIDSADRRVYEIVDDKVRIMTLDVTPQEEAVREQYEKFIFEKAIKDGKNASSGVPNTVALYSRSIKQVSDYLYGEERLSVSLYLLDDLTYLNKIYEELLHGDGYLHIWNEKGNRTLSSAVMRLIEMKQSKKDNPSFFFRPTVISTWNYFKEKGLVGDFETFSATQDMMVGDFLLIYVGKKDNEKEAGIYALATIVESPFINKNEKDVSFGKLAVKAKYVVASNEVIINYEKTIEIAKQLQSAHKIDDKYSEFIEKSFGI